MNALALAARRRRKYCTAESAGTKLALVRRTNGIRSAAEVGADLLGRIGITRDGVRTALERRRNFFTFSGSCRT